MFVRATDPTRFDQYKKYNVFGMLPNPSTSGVYYVVFLPTYKFLVINRRVKLGVKFNFFTNTVSIISNTGIA